MEARSRLRELEVTDPEFYAELTTMRCDETAPPENVAQPEDVVDRAEEHDDDCDVPIKVVIEAMTGKNIRKGFASGENGGIASTCAAEEFEDDVSVDNHAYDEELGRGKRQRRPNTLYSSRSFWRHNDDSDED